MLITFLNVKFKRYFTHIVVDAIRPDVANVNRYQPPQRKDDMKENLYNTPNVQTPPMKTFYNKSTVGPYATTTLIVGNNMLNKNDNSAFRYVGFYWSIFGGSLRST